MRPRFQVNARTLIHFRVRGVGYDRQLPNVGATSQLV